MMKLTATLGLAAAALSGAEASSNEYCMYCTLPVALLEQIGAPELQTWLDGLCDDSAACKLGMKELVELIEGLLNPDEICKDLTLCDGSCTLYADTAWPLEHKPESPPTSLYGGSRRLRAGLTEGRQEVAKALKKVMNKDSFSAWTGVAKTLAGITGQQWPDATDAAVAAAAVGELNPCGTDVSCMISRIFDDHLPLIDHDGDDFAPAHNGLLGETFRGAMWRGADCNDKDGNVYPGRNPGPGGDADVDSNCNGIWGSNSTGTYEDLFCADTPQRGLVILGDSATAHFHIPPQWLTADGWDLDFLVPDGANELDNPACSWGTGFVDGDHCPYATVNPVDSLYERYRARNLCMHRDFQNVGVNGARMTTSDKLANSMHRDQENDLPVTVVLSLIGNDVCNGHEDTLASMTSVDDYRSHAQDTLSILDGKLPADSAVIMVGLVDGRVLYDNMHGLQHPIGAEYHEVYDYLTCNGENPCAGWLSSNETLRNLTTAHAESLTAVQTELVDAQNYSNFQLYTIDPDWVGFINDYVDESRKNKASDLIEPVDGFHPSTAGNALLSADMWSILEDQYPELLGAVNPHNDEIAAMFGDQGGY